MTKKVAKKSAMKAPAAKKSAPKLLSGDNPQIAKGYGKEPVKAYIAAIPGWKQGVARRIDALVTRAVPGVMKAVKWNSPLYGVEEAHYFLSFHMFAKYVKVAFHRGALLAPPPGSSTQEGVRYLDIREGDAFDEKQFLAWVEQASKLPGVKM